MCLVQSQAASSEWAEHSTVAGQRLQKLCRHRSSDFGVNNTFRREVEIEIS